MDPNSLYSKRPTLLASLTRRAMPPPPPPPEIQPENPLHLPTQKLTLCCPALDRLLGGGVPCGTVTELAGECGAGKTQLCLQLVLAAVLPPTAGGLSAASLYLHSEHPFPLRRLHKLSLAFSSPSATNPLDHILVRGAHSTDELLVLLSHADTLLANPPTGLPIKLIIIDSIAAFFRSEFDNNANDLKRRSSLLFKIAATLKEQARRFGAAVVVTNQVVDVVDGGGVGGLRVGNSASLWSSGRQLVPALGLSWANCVNTRLFLSRSDDVRMNGEGVVVGVKTRRRMEVVFAPHLPASSCELVITGDGVFGVG